MTLQTRDEAEIGATLFAGSDYAVLRLLGEGGMGVVYEAQHRPSGRLVALKVMHAGLARKPDVRQRFLREWSVACALSHPHLVAHLASGERAGRLYLALESLPDGDAEAWVERRTGLPAERDIARIGRDVARGLAEVHARGVVHRDVKPSNIFLAEDGSAKLGDFGLARLMRGADAITADGMILGTPDFMAPEQALAEGSLDQRTDLYGLGATMYWLATRETPYDGATAWAIVHRVVSDPFPDPRRRRPDLSPAFAALILRACAKPPAERFQGAEAFADACQALIDGRVPEALAAAPAPLVSAEARRSGVRPLAIVVDDDPLIARLYRSRLEAEGFAVAVAATAQQALTALEAGPPALILLDLVLPDRDGIEVLRDLRRRTRAPVLVLSNAFNRERIHAAREAGADEVLAKSEATPAALAAAVRRLYGGAPEGAPQRPYAEAGAIDLRSATETPMRRLEALAALLEEEAPPGARDGALAELAATCRGVSAAASAVGRTGAASLAAAIELLARHLRDLPGDLTRSTTATIAAAVPVLHDLLSSTEAPRACQAARALVVDDDPLAVRLARLALERVGIAVSCAADAEAAIAELARGRFDLLVLDVVMPGKSGVEVAAAARRDRANRSAAIVFATSLADLRIPAAIAGGALDYIAKPFPAMELATKALTWIHHPARAERP